MRILQASVLVSAVLVLLVPDHCLAQDQVRFADPAPMDPPEERSELQTMLDDGIVASELTEDDIVAVLCNSFGNVFDNCSSAVPFEEYAIEHSERLFGIPAPPPSRKKRGSRYYPRYPSSASSSGGHKSSYRSNSYRPNSYRSNSYRRPSGYKRSELVCPSPIDQSAIYQLSEDILDDIDFLDFLTEFFMDPDLTECLFRSFVLQETPPQVIVEDFLQQANATCPSTEKTLLSYESVRYSGGCVALPTGDFIVYKECSADRFCQGCQDDHSSRSTSQKLCIPEYRAVNLWAFCPSQSPGSRLVRDKIIVPVACNCLDVPCERVNL